MNPLSTQAETEAALAARLHGEIAKVLELNAVVGKMAEAVALNPSFIMKSTSAEEHPAAIRDDDEANVAAMDFV